MPSLNFRHPDGHTTSLSCDITSKAGWISLAASKGYILLSETPTREEASDLRHADGEAQHNALLDLLTAKGILTAAEATARKRKAAR